jgi:hypothetical protein
MLNTKLIKLEDGTLVEVLAQPDEMQQVSSNQVRRVQESIDKIQPILVNACRPLASAWHELNRDVNIEEAEVELGLSFTGEGDIFLVRGEASANLKITLTFKPKSNQKEGVS